MEIRPKTLYNCSYLIVIIFCQFNSIFGYVDYPDMYPDNFDAHPESENSNFVQVKVVNEIAQVEMGNDAFNDEEKNKPKFILTPAKFSGPTHLKELANSCYTFMDEQYKFNFCPFSNVTQEEVQPSLYDPLNVILGVWGEWIIKNNTFTAMKFIEGNHCSSQPTRITEVLLKCGKTNQLLSLKEPRQCNYEGIFETPLACGNNSLVVYPRLSSKLRHEWDRVETEKLYKIITEKGYENELNKIFIDAGLLLPDEEKLLLNEKVLNSCEADLEKLKAKVIELVEQLEQKEDQIRELTQNNKNAILVNAI